MVTGPISRDKGTIWAVEVSRTSVRVSGVKEILYVARDFVKACFQEIPEKET